mmetsp:Transcript_4778/g.8480  ORF Transcript_4778/g.8480 Transcript_4778/m.8480 type:complete len:249 (-) Transcript_4778:32-778(-)|eukprot:CAMPEP_0197651376 /NCGR_PEP_ID=MMETSP1338-20131121/32248_1 /TAXON_ID=43686 ORGANISM="Pelagodinium beii, Strain RCC1491" /NCGR_SAMPLE_ID=MMETSP1338 /ASSEMBLY_ACC=CAM_ASM_000754 /LENGTH=248 /DNA_ID=CAMNT_0043225995 /DNA_START=51 /DNA_END=797 /DNA_ORIENTATION=+
MAQTQELAQKLSKRMSIIEGASPEPDTPSVTPRKPDLEDPPSTARRSRRSIGDNFMQIIEERRALVESGAKTFENSPLKTVSDAVASNLPPSPTRGRRSVGGFTSPAPTDRRRLSVRSPAVDSSWIKDSEVEVSLEVTGPAPIVKGNRVTWSPTMKALVISQPVEVHGCPAHLRLERIGQDLVRLSLQGARPQGAEVRLTFFLGSKFQDGQKLKTWGEEAPMAEFTVPDTTDEVFCGFVFHAVPVIAA